MPKLQMTKVAAHMLAKVQHLQNKTPVSDTPIPPPIKKTKSNAYARSPLIRLAS